MSENKYTLEQVVTGEALATEFSMGRIKLQPGEIFIPAKNDISSDQILQEIDRRLGLLAAPAPDPTGSDLLMRGAVALELSSLKKWIMDGGKL